MDSVHKIQLEDKNSLCTNGHNDCDSRQADDSSSEGHDRLLFIFLLRVEHVTMGLQLEEEVRYVSAPHSQCISAR